MRRRDFIAGLGGAALAIPRKARAQDRIRRICALMAYAESDAEGQTYITAFRDALQNVGWTEGRNIRVDYRWSGPIWTRCKDLRGNSSRCNPRVFLPQIHQRPQRCCGRHIVFQLSLLP